MRFLHEHGSFLKSVLLGYKSLFFPHENTFNVEMSGDNMKVEILVNTSMWYPTQPNNATKFEMIIQKITL